MLLLLTRGEVKDCTPAAAKRREAHAIFMVVYKYVRRLVLLKEFY